MEPFSREDTLYKISFACSKMHDAVNHACIHNCPSPPWLPVLSSVNFCTNNYYGTKLQHIYKCILNY